MNIDEAVRIDFWLEKISKADTFVEVVIYVTAIRKELFKLVEHPVEPKE
uniref:Uncharacterized protein n=1 Tax=viral metagenome TaxID=1070528 RepID=A0A6M3L387_9ZZZZ